MEVQDIFEGMTWIGEAKFQNCAGRGVSRMLLLVLVSGGKILSHSLCEYEILSMPVLRDRWTRSERRERRKGQISKREKKIVQRPEERQCALSEGRAEANDETDKRRRRKQQKYSTDALAHREFEDIIQLHPEKLSHKRRRKTYPVNIHHYRIRVYNSWPGILRVRSHIRILRPSHTITSTGG